MGDFELPPTRSPEQVTITVRRARNLRGLRGDVLTSQIKLEYGDKVLGETPKVDSSAEVAAEYNHSVNMNVTFEDPAFLDELGYKPILLTLVEALPKEKKQKEEKTLNLGQCTIDLMPLLRGESNPKCTLQIHGLPSSPMENLAPDIPRPEVDVELSVNEPLLSESQLTECNLMTVTVESLYSPPESWQLSGAQHMYTASLPVPITGEKENVVVFPSGQLKPGVEKEVPNKQKKWFLPGNAQGNAVYIPDSHLSQDAPEDEAGDFKSKDDREHRVVSEQDKNRVTWNSERRSYLDASATRTLQEKIAKTRYWPMEVMRVPLPSANKGKKDDDGAFSYHGIVYINLAPLLYPGVKRIRGAYKVYAYDEREVYEKTKRKGALADEVVKIASGMLFRNTQSPFAKKATDKGGDKKEPKKGKGKEVAKDDEASAMLKPSDTNSQVDDAPVNVEGLQYVEAKSYVMLEICLNRALVPKRLPEELAKRVAEYIPPRPLFPKRTNGAQRAVEDFHSQVGKVAEQILEEFRTQFGSELAASSDDLPQTDFDVETRRQKLIFELNSSGKYFAFKEQLKHAVVKIVREKYMKTTQFQSKDELQAFLSELYVYLVDQMHVGLGKVLTLEDKTPVPEPPTDAAQLKHFAREAEVNENFELAAKYYRERIVRCKNEAGPWFDYGTFCLYINDISKAEECFKECIAINQQHIPGLLLYGVVCAMEERNEAAETFFEAATCVDPSSILAWTMLGLFYDGIGNEISAEMALMEAKKLNVAVARVATKPNHVKEPAPPATPETMVHEETKESESGDLNLETKSVPSINKIPATPSGVVDNKASLPAKGGNKAGDRRQSIQPGKKAGSMGSRTSSKENVSSARPGSRHLRSPVTTPQIPENHEADEHRESTPVPPQSIYMMAVDWLLEAKAMAFTERALAHELLTLCGGPSPQYHICLARLALQKKDFLKADEALAAALEMDHQNPDAWGIMGHLKYLTADLPNAKDCYERTLSFLATAAETHSIYLRLASIYLQDGKFQDARNTFLMACKRSPSCVSWLGVGIACYRLSELSEAEDALSEANILNNSDPEVWTYLSMVCLKTGRQLEAEQAYKYALKVGLTDEDLLNEIHELQEEVEFGNPQL